jgi:S-adenosylmethionine decarboxylase proenzyme
MDTSASPASFSADLLDCATLGALSGDEIADRFIAALDRAGAHLVNTMSHAFPKAGLTCILILRESHAVLHTWPETGTVNIDIFSCTTRLKSVQAIEDLGKSFGARRLLIQETARANGRVPRAPAAV